MAFCNDCGKQLDVGAKFCDECGAAVKVKELVCNTCGNKLKEGVKFCNECGATTSASPVQVQSQLSAIEIHAQTLRSTQKTGCKTCVRCGKQFEDDTPKKGMFELPKCPECRNKLTDDIDWSAEMITITSEKDLKELADEVINGNDFNGKTIILANDIEIEDGEWEPIGGEKNRFNGTFDGRGNVIKNICINIDSSRSSFPKDIGLFGKTGMNTTIKNLGVMVNITAKKGVRIGGLVGANRGKIENCYVRGTVEGEESVGGLVGSDDDSEISSCYFYGIVNGGKDFVGGLIGFCCSSTIKNCYASGNVNGGMVIGKKSGFLSGLANCEYRIIGDKDLKAEGAMRQQSTYKEWDFENTWAIEPDRNNGFPYLKSQSA